MAIEQIAQQRFPQYDLRNVDARMALTNEQKHEIVNFMIELGLQFGLQPANG